MAALGRRTWRFEIPSLEAKPRLELDHPTGKSGRSPPEVEVARGRIAGIADVSAGGVESKIGKVQLVKNVEKVGADLQIGGFTQVDRVRQLGILRQAQISAEVMRPTEGVALNSGRPGLSDIEVRGRAVGKIPTRTDERVVRVIVQRGA